MMKIVPSILILHLTYVLVVASAPIKQRWTLENALQRAEEISDEMLISLEDVSIAQFQEQAAAHRRFPQLDFSGQYLYTSDVMSIVQAPLNVSLPAPLPAVSIPGKTTSFGDHHTVDFKLQVTQPLFTGFRLSKAYQATRQNTRMKQAEVDRLRWKVHCQVEEQYIQVQKASAWQQAARLRVEVLQRHLEDAQRRVQAGSAPPEMVARAEYGLAQAEYRSQEVNHGYQLAMTSLKELLKLPQDSDDLILDSLEFRPQLQSTTSTDLAFQRRAEFASVEAQLSSLRERVDLQKSAYYPSLAAFGSINYGKPGIDKIANDWMLYETAGLSLNWTLWDWSIRRRQVEEAQAAARQVEHLRSALESRVRLEVTSAQLALENALRRVELAQESQRLAQQVLTWVEARYQQGTATETDYQDTQDDLTTSQIDLIAATADYHLALVALQRALGSELQP